MKLFNVFYNFYKKIDWQSIKAESTSIRTLSLCLVVTWLLFSANILLNIIPSMIGERNIFGGGWFFTESVDYYDFSKALKVSSKINMRKIESLQAHQFEKLILQAAPEYLREDLQKYLKVTLNIAMKYQIDPFWAVAVMWVESNFNHESLSRKSASGLMQLTPETKLFLIKRLENEFGFELEENHFDSPYVNIELGIYYLKALLKRFNSIEAASVAYNMGPNRVRELLDNKVPLESVSGYFPKVIKAYNILSAPYVRFSRKVNYSIVANN